MEEFCQENIQIYYVSKYFFIYENISFKISQKATFIHSCIESNYDSFHEYVQLEQAIFSFDLCVITLFHNLTKMHVTDLQRKLNRILNGNKSDQIIKF